MPNRYKRCGGEDMVLLIYKSVGAQKKWSSKLTMRTEMQEYKSIVFGFLMHRVRAGGQQKDTIEQDGTWKVFEKGNVCNDTG
jgi:hypothetical protein